MGQGLQNSAVVQGAGASSGVGRQFCPGLGLSWLLCLHHAEPWKPLHFLPACGDRDFSLTRILQRFVLPAGFLWREERGRAFILQGPHVLREMRLLEFLITVKEGYRSTEANLRKQNRLHRRHVYAAHQPGKVLPSEFSGNLTFLKPPCSRTYNGSFLAVSSKFS